MGSSCTCLLQMQHGLSYPGNTVLGPGTYVPGKHKPELPPLRGIAQLNKNSRFGGVLQQHFEDYTNKNHEGGMLSLPHHLPTETTVR